MIFEITIFSIFTLLLLYFLAYKYLAVYKNIFLLPTNFFEKADKVSFRAVSFLGNWFRKVKAAAAEGLHSLPYRVARGGHFLWRKISRKVDKFFEKIRKTYH